MGLGVIIDGADFLWNDHRLSFLWSATFPEAIHRKRDSGHQDLAFFLEGILLPSAEKRVKQEPVPYTHENVTFLKRRFASFDGKKKVTQEPLP